MPDALASVIVIPHFEELRVLLNSSDGWLNMRGHPRHFAIVFRSCLEWVRIRFVRMVRVSGIPFGYTSRHVRYRGNGFEVLQAVCTKLSTRLSGPDRGVSKTRE